MASQRKTDGWLKSYVGSSLLAQANADPGLPQPKPTSSLWQQPPHPSVSNHQSAALPATTDFLVIGSGIAGCGAVRTLLNNPSSGSQTVTMLDARGICSGATGRNGGQLVKPYPLRFADLVASHGVEAAKKVTRMALRTLEVMHELAESYDEDLKTQSRARRTTKLTLFTDPVSWENTQKAVRAYEDALPEERGLFKLITKEELASKWNVKSAYGGYAFPAGVCWPYRLVTGVFRRLLDQFPERLNIEANTPVTTILYDSQDAKHPYTITTPRGIIRATKVIHCTNGHAGHLLPLMRGKIVPMRGTMSVQAPGPKFPDLSNEMSWTFLSDPIYDKDTKILELGWWYAHQNKPEGNFWIGGEQKRIEECFTADDSSIGESGKKNLENILPKTFNEKWLPESPKIHGVWTGIMTRTGDALPFVGRLPSSATGRPGDGEWIAAGWNSYGMTNGLTSGEAVARMALGEPMPEWFPEVYLPTEERLAGAKMNSQALVTEFLDWSGVGATIVEESSPASKL